ncbi:Rhs family protein [Streptomyces sp. NBRC 110611]|uniref:hypothetical protein n=1 Tax=Streptomyces sp. NBRC 110611 TaxID=1621259 RepID=UPI0008358200|nr:hypothetical protein [Streptomyces sp. NBRC 110611]GAU68969.1 Rhs family protein [Streptomyces sp. NBRC 110611]
MAGNGTIAEITATGGHVKGIDERAFAILVSEPPLPRWRVIPVDGRIQLQEVDTGRFLTAPHTDDWAQAAVNSTDASTPNSRWIAHRADDDPGRESVEITETGFYTLKLAGSDRYLSLLLAEHRSLLPKRLVLGPNLHALQPRLLFEVVS